MIRVLAAVIYDRDKMLVCRRPTQKRHGQLWEFPGGKIEEGESDLQAAIRELAEELGVTVLSVGESEFSFQDPGSEFMIEFMPVTIAGQPQCLEHLAHAWVTLEEAASYPLAPSDREYISFLTAGGGVLGS